MTAGEPDPVQWICRRRAPISTSWPKGGGGGAALSCAFAGRANASKMRTERISLLLVTQWLLRGIPSKAATVLPRAVSRSSGTTSLRPQAHGGLPRLARSQAPQPAHREDDGENCGHGEREECPDEEEGAGGPALAESNPRHVNDGDARRKERQD